MFLPTYTDTIVPESDIVLAPLVANMEFLSCGDDFIEVSNDGIAFRLGHSDNGFHETRVEEERFPAGNRIDADDWVLSDDRLTAKGTIQGAGTIGLDFGRVQCCQALQILLHRC